MTERAEEILPAHIYRHIHHYHNVIYVRNYYDSLGIPVPRLITEELERMEKESTQLYERERQQGGFLHKREEKIG